MGFYSFLEEYFPKWFKKETVGKAEPILIEIPETLQIKEMALYTASSILANAISGCEFRVYQKGKRIKDNDWYRLNIAPNKNENASLFWNKVINRMIRSPNGALVVHINNELHCAKSFNVDQENPIHGNLYGSVVLDGGIALEKVFQAEEVMLFRLEDKTAEKYISTISAEYEAIFKSAVRAFKESNGNRYKLKLNSIATGDEEFAEDYEEYIKEQLENYIKNENAVYVEYQGYELKKEDGKQPKSAEDLLRIKKDIFEMTGQALKIPSSLMKGEVTSIKDVSNVLLTFAVDPIAEMIQRTLNKMRGMADVLNGTYYVVYTGKIKHRDTIEDAPNIYNLIASGFANIDEVRNEEGYEEIGEDWSKEHYITKNYGKIEDVLDEKGGGKNET